MFLQNKYTAWYLSMIEKAKLRKIDGYTERHHIVPKSFGGSNEEDNLVKLTAREHFICHLLLIRMTEGSYKGKMIHALWRFVHGNKKFIDLKINSRLYEHLKIRRSELMKNRIRTPEEEAKRKASRAWYKHSLETKKKISESNKGQKRSKETKQKLVDAHQNMSDEAKHERSRKMKEKAAMRQPMSEDTKEKCAEFHRGRKRSEETKQKMREAMDARLIKKQVTKLKNAKIWTLEDRAGNQFEISDLRKFAKEKGLSEKSLYRSKETKKYVGDYLVLKNRIDRYQVVVRLRQ